MKEKNTTQQSTTPQNYHQTTPTPFLLDETDRKLLEILQQAFPIVNKPWQKIGVCLGIEETEVLQRLKRLSKAGIIRKVGAIVDVSKLGLTNATLVAMQVPKDNLEKAACIINEYDNVSHNYERQHTYNLWFTLAASKPQEIEGTIAEITQKIGLPPNSVLNLPTIQRFKINVFFPLTNQNMR